MNSELRAEAIDVLVVVDGMTSEQAASKVDSGGEALATKIVEHLDSRRGVIRYSEDASICMAEDESGFRAPTQEDMDTLPVGSNLTEEEIAGLDS